MLGFSYAHIKQLLRNYPLEIGVMALLSCMSIHLNTREDGVFLASLNPILAPIYFAMIYLSNGKKTYWISWLFPWLMALDIAFRDQDGMRHLVGFTLICFLLLMGNPPLSQNKLFLQNILRNVATLVLTVIIANILVVSFITLESAAEILLNLSFSIPVKEHIITALYIMSGSLLYIHFNQVKQGKAFKFFAIKEISSLLTLVLFLYTVIIYIYLDNILIALELPRESVANVMLPYLFLVIFCAGLHIVAEQGKWDKFYRLLPWLTLLPVALLWWGVTYRINQYGLTEGRVYLMGVTCFLILFGILFLIKKWFQYRFVLILAVSMIITFTIVLSPKQLAQESQYQRFVELATKLNVLTAENKINPEFLKPYQEIDVNRFNQKGFDEAFKLMRDYVEVYSVAVERYGKESLATLRLNLSEYYYNEPKFDEKATIFSVYNTTQNNPPIDIQPYSAFYIIKNKVWVDLSQKIKQAKSVPKTITFEDIDEQTYQFDMEPFFASFKQAGIDLSKQHSEAELQRGYPTKLVFKTQDGKLVLFQLILFQWVEFPGGGHYVPTKVEMLGYFQ